MNRRVGEVVLIAIAILLVLFGVLSKDWFSEQSEEMSLRVGLREVTGCTLGSCQSVELKSIGAKPSLTMSGNVAFFSAVLAAVLGALAGGIHLAGKRVVGPISPARIAAAFFITTAVGGVVFIIAMDRGTTGLGMAGPQAIAGGLFGAVGCIMIAMRRESIGTLPPPVASAVPPQAAMMSPACPQCGAPTEMNEQHKRWFCAACRAYV